MAWMKQCFGQEIAEDHKTRSLALLEETLELCQATGITEAEIAKAVKYTYGRPVGEVPQEVGGVMISVAGLCSAHNISMEHAMQMGLAYCVHNTRKIRSKQKDKVKAGIRHLLPPDPKDAKDPPVLKCDWLEDDDGNSFVCVHCGDTVANSLMTESVRDRACPKRGGAK
jgi:NTP pyrophosphatase (non-canonical NTP hydrolase)